MEKYPEKTFQTKMMTNQNTTLGQYLGERKRVHLGRMEGVVDLVDLEIIGTFKYYDVKCNVFLSA